MKIKKPELTLFPSTALIGGALAMMDGVAKHGGAYNWRKKGRDLSLMEMVSKVQRHLVAYIDGEDEAEDSGLPHYFHALADLAVMIDADTVGKMKDDRPLPGYAAESIASYTKETE